MSEGMKETSLQQDLSWILKDPVDSQMNLGTS